MNDAVDPFAGPGGWSLACAVLGIDELGIELDAAACETRRAAGFRTVENDVSRLEPADFPARGLIASPPCQAFSSAGKQEGRDHIPELAAAIHRRDWTARPDPDPRVWLVLEVGRWYEALQPEWIVLEQVPAVAPMWRAYAHILRADGYSTWTGILNAADYGVPQTRQRAILIASRTRTVHPPEATHAKDPTPGLFGTLERWVTMAEALGYDHPFRIGFPRLDDRGDSPDGYRERDWRSGDELAHTVTEKARSWILNTGRAWAEGGTREDAQTIDVSENPAPALTAKSGGQWQLRSRRDSERWTEEHGERPNRDDIEPAPTITGEAHRWKWQLQANARKNGTIRAEDEPAPTLALGNAAADWIFTRPATTIAGDYRAFPPGSHIAHDGRNLENAVGRSEGAIRLTVEDALILQSFPPDFPVQGSQTKKFEQIGNAIPPRLAWHILRTLTE